MFLHCIFLFCKKLLNFGDPCLASSLLLCLTENNVLESSRHSLLGLPTVGWEMIEILRVQPEDGGVCRGDRPQQSIRQRVHPLKQPFASGKWSQSSVLFAYVRICSEGCPTWKCHYLLESLSVLCSWHLKHSFKHKITHDLVEHQVMQLYNYNPIHP